MPEESLEQRLTGQRFDNGYELVNGVAMHEQHGDRFQIPHPVLKKYVAVGYFIELRIDSPRFSAHPDAPETCTCPHCNELATKPILSHEQPASLVDVTEQTVPSRGWGEEFWARVTLREGDHFRATVDNPLYEARLHGLRLGDEVFLHADHILAVHPTHRQEMVARMDVDDIKQLVAWLGSSRE